MTKTDMLFIAGLALILAGTALISLPFALIAAGASAAGAAIRIHSTSRK